MILLLKISQNQMSLYTALIGVGGTLLGTILGYILSSLNRLGIRKVNVTNIELNYCFGHNQYGEIESSEFFDENGNPAKSCYINADLYITNPSDQAFNANNLSLIVKCEKSYYKAVITDRNYIRKIGGGYQSEKVSSITIPGKAGEYFKLRCCFSKPIPQKEKYEYYLEYLNVKGNVVKKKIKIR